jgi:hypothetical protein
MVDRAAAEPITFDAGIACDFALTLDSGTDTRSTHVLTDSDGNQRVILAGRGTPVTLTNEDTGATLSFRANGSTWSIVTDAEGTTNLHHDGPPHPAPLPQ